MKFHLSLYFSLYLWCLHFRSSIFFSKTKPNLHPSFFISCIFNSLFLLFFLLLASFLFLIFLSHIPSSFAVFFFTSLPSVTVIPLKPSSFDHIDAFSNCLYILLLNLFEFSRPIASFYVCYVFKRGFQKRHKVLIFGNYQNILLRLMIGYKMNLTYFWRHSIGSNQYWLRNLITEWHL